MITDALGNEVKVGDLVMYASGKQYYNLELHIGVIKEFYRQWRDDKAEPNFVQIFTLRGKKLMTNLGGIASRKLKGVVKCPNEIAVNYDFAIGQYNEYLQTNTLQHETSEN